MSDAFAQAIVQWQRVHGRNHLPWQAGRDPYRVWLSEIMLQQTQVATVLGYFDRFVQRLPTVQALAEADEDTVMGLWSGLGYYSRARNLHRCAQELVQRFGGAFPRDAATLATLPGIGRSTAAAITSVCFGERVSILDANVKRVLSRVLAWEQDLAQTKAVRELWAAADTLLPATGADMPAYTQGMMDLGASLCSVRQPQCLLCPVQAHCQAKAQGRATDFPIQTRKLQRSAQQWWVLWAQQEGSAAIWLHKRPSRGVWAGLHCLPMWGDEASVLASLPATLRAGVQSLPVVKHVLTHRDLYLHPLQVLLPAGQQPQCEGAWVQATDWPALGLPAPIRKLLERG